MNARLLSLHSSFVSVVLCLGLLKYLLYSLLYYIVFDFHSLDLDNDERVSKLSQLKAQLVTCFEPEVMKDILFELHEIPPEQSHAGVSSFGN